MRLFKRLIVVFLLFPGLLLQAADDIVLRDFEGQKRQVSEFVGKGKWVVLVIWASDCHICNQEIHQMTFFHNEHSKHDAIVLGVSIDGRERIDMARKFIERHSLNFTNLLAEAEDLDQFPTPFFGTPTYYIYTPSGKLASWQVGAVTQAQVEAFIEKTKVEIDPKDKKG